MTLHAVTPLHELAELDGVTIEYLDIWPDYVCQICKCIDCLADCTVTWLPPLTRQRRTAGLNCEAHGIDLKTAIAAFVAPVTRSAVVVRLPRRPR